MKSYYYELKEGYTPQVTMPYSDWVNYITSENRMYGDSVYPSDTYSGTVYAGHVRQNPMTANLCQCANGYLSSSCCYEEEDSDTTGLGWIL